MEKREPLYTVFGNVNVCIHYEKQYEDSSKTKIRTITLSSNSTPGYIAEENENIKSKRYMYPKVCSSIIYNNQGMEATKVSINR